MILQGMVNPQALIAQGLKSDGVTPPVIPQKIKAKRLPPRIIKPIKAKPPFRRYL